VHDRALLFGLDALDDWDLRAWLRRHGARPETADAPFIKAWYDLAFAYEDGDTTRPNFAAGAALRAILRTALTYKGAIFWKMQAGMGDVVFAPLHEVLRRRGVRFEFFHRVDELEVESLASTHHRHRVSRVRMTVQATPRDGHYDPLVDVDGLPCWPSTPRHEQLLEGEQLQRDGVDLECPWSPWPGVGTRTLERGRDFDDVILGISLGAIPALCPTLVAHDPAWRRMVDHVKTVATQAAQLWMNPTLEQLGWHHPSPVLDAYDDPFNTWADMSCLLPREAWRGEQRPASLAYLVGPLHEHAAPPPPGPEHAGFQARQVDAVRAHARRWLDRAAPGIWPAAARGNAPPSFDTTTLFTSSPCPADARIDAQYLRANVAGSERYVQSLRGSTRHRLFTASCDVEGLYPVGDWLNTGINSGDVEAATISGLQAARAILGHARPISGEGDGWFRHRVDARPATPPPTIGAPPTRTLPPSGSTMPAAIRSSVDLPAPFSPSTSATSPASQRSSAPSRIGRPPSRLRIPIISSSTVAPPRAAPSPARTCPINQVTAAAAAHPTGAHASNHACTASAATPSNNNTATSRPGPRVPCPAAHRAARPASAARPPPASATAPINRDAPIHSAPHASATAPPAAAPSPAPTTAAASVLAPRRTRVVAPPVCSNQSARASLTSSGPLAADPATSAAGARNPHA
jgi:uncharacterized protein with NAD-binding domain and iron-sulfur cluster